MLTSTLSTGEFAVDIGFNHSEEGMASNGSFNNDYLNHSNDTNCGYEYNYDYDPYEGYHEYYDDYYYLQIFMFEVPVLGYCRPALVCLTLLMNLLVIGYFSIKKNRGKSSNLLFISIAISDTLTGVALLPNSFEIYARDWIDLSKEWCDAYMILRLYVSAVFHTVSIWQTLLLGVQRYVCVCQPFISARVCTFWKTFGAIGLMYVLSAVLHSYHLTTDNVGSDKSCQWQVEFPCRETCVYLWCTILFQHLLPAILLVVLTILTIVALTKAHRRVSTIVSQKAATFSRRSKEKVVTWTAVIIVIFFLIPELPHGLYKLYQAIGQDFEGSKKNIETNHIIYTVYEISLIVSFNANFWIFIVMMNDFRRYLLRIATCGLLTGGIARLRTWSASSFKSSSSVRSNGTRNSSVNSRHRILSRTVSAHSTTSDNIHAVRLVSSPTSDTETIQFPAHAHAHGHTTNDDVFM